MQKEYATILEPGFGEIVEKKSRFIGYVCHVESEKAAIDFVTSVKKKHYDARHNCFAYVVGEENPIFRFSDDGEPGGTAGKPILEVITGNGLCNICIVVTRYFGGTLLGTGGLVRAYTEAAKAAVSSTNIVRKRMVQPVRIHTNYNDLGKLQYILGSEGITTLESEYGQDVVLLVEILVDEVDRIMQLMTEATAARVSFEKEEVIFSVCGV